MRILLKNILIQTFSIEDKVAEVKETVILVPPVTHMVKGYHGMWQYHFEEQNAAATFLKQVQNFPDLKSLGIEKANIKEEKCKQSATEKCFIVHFIEQQKLKLKEYKETILTRLKT